MAQRLKQTQYGDAPLSAAKNPDPRTDVDSRGDADGQLVGRTVTINQPRRALYDFWREFKNLPRFMHDLHSVTPLADGVTHWVVSAPAGKFVEWDSTITEDIPGEVIAWASTEGASIRNSGRIEFRDAPGGRGTEVTATIVYDPPAGAVGKLVAKLFQKEPHIQARRELRRFKQLMETGEVSTSHAPDAAPRG